MKFSININKENSCEAVRNNCFLILYLFLNIILVPHIINQLDIGCVNIKCYIQPSRRTVKLQKIASCNVVKLWKLYLFHILSVLVASTLSVTYSHHVLLSNYTRMHHVLLSNYTRMHRVLLSNYTKMHRVLLNSLDLLGEKIFE